LRPIGPAYRIRRTAGSVQAGPVALGVLHDHEPGLHPAVGIHAADAGRAQPDEAGGLHLEGGHPHVAGGAGSCTDVEMKTVLDVLALGHPLEEQPWTGAAVGRVRGRAAVVLLGKARGAGFRSLRNRCRYRVGTRADVLDEGWAGRRPIEKLLRHNARRH
jgi:hypothetical protein